MAKFENKFLPSLQKIHNNFHLEAAEELSMEMHLAEAQGYEISPQEELVWFLLTDLVQQGYSNGTS